jgi:hypothetical protein
MFLSGIGILLNWITLHVNHCFLNIEIKMSLHVTLRVLEKYTIKILFVYTIITDKEKKKRNITINSYFKTQNTQAKPK